MGTPDPWGRNPGNPWEPHFGIWELRNPGTLGTQERMGTRRGMPGTNNKHGNSDDINKLVSNTVILSYVPLTSLSVHHFWMIFLIAKLCSK